MVLGGHAMYYASKQALITRKYSFALPKGSPIKVFCFQLSQCPKIATCNYTFQTVFYHAISWLQDTGVLQKMNNDIWRIYGKFNEDVIRQRVAVRPLKIADTLAGLLLLVLGLSVALIGFLLEIIGWHKLTVAKKRGNGSKSQQN